MRVYELFEKFLILFTIIVACTAIEISFIPKEFQFIWGFFSGIICIIVFDYLRYDYLKRG